MKPTHNEYKRYIELISDIPTEDIIDAAWDCNMIEPCYKCKWLYVCNKHDIGGTNTMENNVNQTILKKLAKKHHKHITWLEKIHNECDNSNVYFIVYDGVDATVDTLSELKWACNYIAEHHEYNF